MLSTNKIWFKSFMVLILFSALFPACTSEEPLRPGVQAFREQMLADYDKLKSSLIPALEDDDPVVSSGKAIEIFLQELKNNNHRIFGISLLDVSGEYLTGFVIEDINTGKLIKDKYKNMNFHSFKVVEQIINSRKVIQEQLYFQDASILAIGFPVIKEGDLLGIVCFSFKSYEFKKRWGISKEEFLQIDFGKV